MSFAIDTTLKHLHFCPSSSLLAIACMCFPELQGYADVLSKDERCKPIGISQSSPRLFHTNWLEVRYILRASTLNLMSSHYTRNLSSICSIRTCSFVRFWYCWFDGSMGLLFVICFHRSYNSVPKIILSQNMRSLYPDSTQMKPRAKSKACASRCSQDNVVKKGQRELQILPPRHLHSTTCW